MSFEIPSSFRQDYKDAVVQLLQQRGSRFRPTVMVDTFTGKVARSVIQIGAVNARKRTTRHGDTPLISTPHDARWVYPQDYDWADLIDNEDALKAGVTLASPYAINGASSMARAMDDETIAAFFGSANTGENGLNSVAFPAAQQIAASYGSSGGAVGLNVAKLREARRLLWAAEADLDNDPAYVAVSAKQHDDLLAEVQVTSTDFNDKPVLVEGKIMRFMGFNFVHSERLQTDASAYRRVPVWVKSGVCLGLWNDIQTEVTARPDKNYAKQVFVTGTFGATRIEEKKVVEIKCSEA
ncbi:MAG: phage capsid protein [Alphaproteobacteria bacterium]